MSLAFIIGFASAFAWVYLAVANGLFWLPLVAQDSGSPKGAPSVDILVPARNESETLSQTLPSLLAQSYPGKWKIILVDDHSDDKTGDVARTIAASMRRQERLHVIEAPDIPDGWTGKVAAMRAGLAESKAEYVLFTDADIRHPIRSIEKLVAAAQERHLDLVSRMVRLNCENAAERLLIPAFVFFFAMLYPFRRANNPRSSTAAAAGGTMLVRRKMLDDIGGMDAIKSALIDDCSLAKAIKRSGGFTELTLSREIASVRSCPHVKDVWKMIARTAYTQLQHSPFILFATIMGLALLFLAPYLLILFGPPTFAPFAGFIAALVMALLYIPMIRFYNLPILWTLSLPAAALVYAAATIDSARLYHLGKGGQWKGRAQA
ncbi:MAG: glycosyltransferase [Alphaproteobacteria bacterium]|nr:glycosyltransferase [Alphaproteobacteria bacterium]